MTLNFVHAISLSIQVYSYYFWLSYEYLTKESKLGNNSVIYYPNQEKKKRIHKLKFDDYLDSHKSKLKTFHNALMISTLCAELVRLPTKLTLSRYRGSRFDISSLKLTEIQSKPD